MTDESARDEIMTATYEALCEHGYTELTTQAIADQTDKSKSLLFYHYDSKDDIISAFFDFLLEHFDERLAASQELSPVERLAALVDWFLYDPDDDERASFHTAMLELRAQAPYDERFQVHLRRSDDALRAAFEGILQDGLEAGVFREHDPAETATVLIAALDGARIRQLTMSRDAYLEEVRSGVANVVVADLLVEGESFPERGAVSLEAVDAAAGDDPE
ncbi:TetR/AcrR family transcriptional regulator [Saliphagus sp. GCM10025308]